MTVMQWVLALIATLGNFLAFWIYLDTGQWVWLVITLCYSAFGIRDVLNRKHPVKQLYPVVGHIRYFLESFHDEIHQYFIASNTEELPFNREQRSIVYRRAKKINDAKPFGTERDLLQPNYITLAHSLSPVHVDPAGHRVKIGGEECAQPYEASRLNISAMSYGSLSAPAITALNKGARLAGCYHNTGEGSISPYHLQGGDLVWQIGSGLFGCRTHEGDFDEQAFSENAKLDVVKMIEIKLSQGAKPSHGGVLPQAKITPEIAKVRMIASDRDCVSPAVHPLAQSTEQLLQSVKRLRALAGGKPVGFKLCIGSKREFVELVKQMLATNIYPDFITVDGAEGGTGAAPVEFSNRLGLFSRDAILFVSQVLIGAGIRDRITVIASGKTATGFDLLEKLALGADVVNAARTMLFALGCIQSQSCHTNTCPTGIATQDTRRSRALDVDLKHRRVANFHAATVEHACELLGAMGLERFEKLEPWMLDVRGHDGQVRPLLAKERSVTNAQLLDATSLPDEWERLWRQGS